MEDKERKKLLKEAENDRIAFLVAYDVLKARMGMVDGLKAWVREAKKELRIFDKARSDLYDSAPYAAEAYEEGTPEFERINNVAGELDNLSLSAEDFIEDINGMAKDFSFSSMKDEEFDSIFRQEIK